LTPAGSSPIGERPKQAPEALAQHRIEADRRLVEDEQLRPAEESRGQREPRPLTARQRARELPGRVAEVDLLDDLGDLLRACAHDRGKVLEVLAHCEVLVGRLALRAVPDAAPQRRRPRHITEHPDFSAHTPLDADDDAHQRRLAPAARPDQAGDAPAGQLEREAVQHLAPAPPHSKVARRYRRLIIHPAMILSPERR
jgi:hypothetical protein